MLWATTLGEELIPEDVLPQQVNYLNARSEELTEVSSFHFGRPDGTGRPILDVPRDGGEVGGYVDIVIALADVGVEVAVSEIGGHGWGEGGEVGKVILVY